MTDINIRLRNWMKLNGLAVECLPATRAASVQFPSNASMLVVLIKSYLDIHFLNK